MHLERASLFLSYPPLLLSLPPALLHDNRFHNSPSRAMPGWGPESCLRAKEPLFLLLTFSQTTRFHRIEKPQSSLVIGLLFSWDTLCRRDHTVCTRQCVKGWLWHQRNMKMRTGASFRIWSWISMRHLYQIHMSNSPIFLSCSYPPLHTILLFSLLI